MNLSFPLTHATRLALTIVAFFLLLVLAVVLNFGLSRYAIDRSQSHWCDTLTLLTKNPIPKPPAPAVNPSREQNYEFYIALVQLRKDFGCH